MLKQLHTTGIIIGCMVLLCFTSMTLHQLFSDLNNKIELPCDREEKKSVVILPLEFATNSQEGLATLNLWQTVAASDDVKQTFFQNVKFQIILDYFFMLCYGAFFAFFGYYFSIKADKKIFQLGILFAVLMILGDAIENWQMLNIISDYTSANYQMLNFSTWLKWSSIGLCFLLFSTYFFTKRSLGNKVLGIVMLLPFLSWLIIFYFFKIQGNPVEPCHPNFQYGIINFVMIAVGLFGLLLFLIGQQRKVRGKV